MKTTFQYPLRLIPACWGDHPSHSMRARSAAFSARQAAGGRRRQMSTAALHQIRAQTEQHTLLRLEISPVFQHSQIVKSYWLTLSDTV